MTSSLPTLGTSTIIPAMRYRDAPAMIDWLSKVLGFEKHVVYANADGTIGHAELTLGGGMIMLGSKRDDEFGRRLGSPEDLSAETRCVYIVVADVDAVHARAQEANAPIVRPLQNTDYGSREFTVRDPEGHTWSVGTYNPWAAHS